MADVGAWRPLHDTHAIQLCAITISFSEPVGDVTWRKSLRDVQPIADGLGLVEQSSMVPSLPPELGAFGFKVAEQQGMIFSKNENNGRVSERFNLLRDSLRFEDFSYVRWRPFKDRARKLMEAVFNRHAEVSSLDSITSEYMDVFLFSGTESDSKDISPLIERNSPFVASGAYRPADSWHCHTGWFEQPDRHARYLLNVNIDVRDEILDAFQGRVARVRTSIAVQFGRDGFQVLEDDQVNWNLVDHHLEASHAKLKMLLSSIITRQAATAIALS